MVLGTKINYTRFWLGSLAAGIFLNAITAIGNSTFLKSTFEVWAVAMSERIHPPEPAVQITLWTIMCFVDAFISMWIYVAIRPRYGAGPRTALAAGFAVWIVGRFCVALDMLGLGVFPLHMMFEQGLLGLLAILPGTLLGAWIYRD